MLKNPESRGIRRTRRIAVSRMIIAEKARAVGKEVNTEKVEGVGVVIHVKGYLRPVCRSQND